MASCKLVWIVSLFSIVQCREHFIYVTQLNKSLETLKTSGYSNKLGNDNTKGTDVDSAKDSDVGHVAGNQSIIFKMAKELLKELHVFESEMFDEEMLRELAEKHPSTLDLTGSANAIKRIQSAYNVTNQEVVNGNVFGVTSMKLTVEDIAELGLLYYSIDRHLDATLWLVTTVQLLKTSTSAHAYTLSNVLHKFALTASEYGNLIDAARFVSVLRKQEVTILHNGCFLAEVKVTKRYLKFYNTDLTLRTEELEVADRIFRLLLWCREIRMNERL